MCHPRAPPALVRLLTAYLFMETTWVPPSRSPHSTPAQFLRRRRAPCSQADPQVLLGQDPLCWHLNSRRDCLAHTGHSHNDPILPPSECPAPHLHLTEPRLRAGLAAPGLGVWLAVANGMSAAVTGADTGKGLARLAFPQKAIHSQGQNETQRVAPGAVSKPQAH